MKFISFPKIGQFREVIRNIKHEVIYVCQDENDNPVFDYTKIAPTLTAYGTVKLHGSNGTVTYSKDGLQAQKRTSIITQEKDNAGFAAFVKSNEEIIIKICKDLMIINNLDINDYSILLPGEWAGQGIQKGVGISNIPKSWFIFADFKVIPNDDRKSYWCETKGMCSPNDRIYNITDFETFQIDIDFENLGECQNQMIEMVEYVENECPVSKKLGFPNEIGEGIVFVVYHENTRHIFKTKGTKHSNSKVKTLRPVDDELINKKIEIANKVCPAWRLEQIYDLTFDTLNGGKGDIKRFGEFIKSVNIDIIKEEIDIIVEAGFIPKDIFKFTPKIIKEWFNTRLNEESGLV